MPRIGRFSLVRRFVAIIGGFSPQLKCAVTLPTRFIYVPVILDAWSRLIAGYAIGRSIDARLTLAALKAAIERVSRPWMHSSFRSRIAIRSSDLPRRTASQ